MPTKPEGPAQEPQQDSEQQCARTIQMLVEQLVWAWEEIEWRGVGNEFAGKADRCDVESIWNALTDLAEIVGIEPPEQK